MTGREEITAAVKLSALSHRDDVTFHFPVSPSLTETLLTLSCPAPLSALDKLFGKRLLQARHYIMSRKSWLKMVPTENCDILMTFPGAPGRASFVKCLWWTASLRGRRNSLLLQCQKPAGVKLHPVSLWKIIVDAC